MLRRLLLLALFFAGCTTTRDLTPGELTKLDARLQSLLAADTRTAPGDVDTSLRPDGEREYGVIIRGGTSEELRKAGIPVAGGIGDILTARVTVEELKTLARIGAVRSIECAKLVSPNK